MKHNPGGALVSGAAVMLAIGFLASAPASAQQSEQSRPGQPSVEQRFQRLDANKDGFITWEEAEPMRTAEFKDMDRNKDGVVRRKEFRDRARPFRAFDRDKDGAISQEEYLASHKDMFLKFDADKDNRISPAEFAAAHGLREASTANERARLAHFPQSGLK